ncbi:hypothetical protein ACFLZP_01750 [Patescibacteria group bacterium]
MPTVEQISRVPDQLSSAEPLSWEEVGLLFAAVGNHEAKAITLMAMERGVYGMADLYHRLLAVQGTPPGWQISRRIPSTYCERSLVPAGLVEKKRVNDVGCWRKTDYGTRVGDALVGHLLTATKGVPQSLVQLFGKTASGGKRREIRTTRGTSVYRRQSPVTRLLIFKSLLTARLPISVVDFVEGLDLSADLAVPHLHQLAAAGVIVYQKRGHDQSFRQYQALPGALSGCPASYRRVQGERRLSERTLTQAVWEAMRATSEWKRSDQIVQTLLKDYPQWREISSLLDRVRGVLVSLTEQGFLKTGQLAVGEFSRIEVTDEQRQLLLRISEIADGIATMDRDFLAAGREKAARLIACPGRLAALMAKAKKDSAQANKVPREVTEKNIIQLVGDNPGIGTDQLKLLLENNFGQRLLARTIASHVRRLGEKGILKVVEGRTGKYWSLNED